MPAARLEPRPRPLAVLVAGAVALHEQSALRGGGEPDESVATLLRTLAAAGAAAGRPIMDLRMFDHIISSVISRNSLSHSASANFAPLSEFYIRNIREIEVFFSVDVIIDWPPSSCLS